MRKKLSLQSKLLGLCFVCTIPPLQAAEEENAETEMPDLEMLEFLGQFATDEGEWLDPDSLLSDEFGELLDDAMEQQQQETERNLNSDNNRDQP